MIMSIRSVQVSQFKIYSETYMFTYIHKDNYILQCVKQLQLSNL